MEANGDKTEINGDFKPISIGFIGFGTIASAIATGLAGTQVEAKTDKKIPTFSKINVTLRSEKRSSAIKLAFPELVSIYEDNQQIVDNSDIVFLCVLNDQTATVLEHLKFDSNRHTLVSLVATSTLVQLREYSNLPHERVFKMICLPTVAKREGCGLIVPKSDKKDHAANFNIRTLHKMVSLLGGYVECEDEEQMNVMITPTCLMGTMYAILRQNQQWLVQKGVPAQDATYFIGRSYWSMLQDAERGCDHEPNRFDELVAEQTPGGLNEQALRNMEQLGALGAYSQVMDAVYARLKGVSDGSLPNKKPKPTDP